MVHALVYRVAVQAVMKAGQYAYRDRRNKKRSFRRLWIARINAGARLNGLSYSRLINGLKRQMLKLTVAFWPISPCMMRLPLLPLPKSKSCFGIIIACDGWSTITLRLSPKTIIHHCIMVFIA